MALTLSPARSTNYYQSTSRLAIYFIHCCYGVQIVFRAMADLSGRGPSHSHAIDCNALDSFLAVSPFPESKKSRGNIPMTQPTVMPTAQPSWPLKRTLRSCLCACERFGCGIPRREQMSSMTVPRPTPATSLTMLPRAAAHMVEIPNVTPKLLSMASPARIRRALSMKPNPTKGIAWLTATSQRSLREGSATGSAEDTASAASDAQGACLEAEALPIAFAISVRADSDKRLATSKISRAFLSFPSICRLRAHSATPRGASPPPLLEEENAFQHGLPIRLLATLCTKNDAE